MGWKIGEDLMVNKDKNEKKLANILYFHQSPLLPLSAIRWSVNKNTYMRDKKCM